MTYKEELETRGFFIVKNVFSNNEIEEFKNEIMNYIRTKKIRRGSSIPDFIKRPELKKVSDIKDNKKINEILSEIFDKNYRFCSHNDIGINRATAWHKDKLNNKYEKYETHDIWSEFEGETHEIVKVLIYLQDHSNDNDGLKVIPYSHLERCMYKEKLIVNTEDIHQLRPGLGDIIIFDQRITHQGADKEIPRERILVSFGFGKNNIFTDNFEKGTIIRQNEQNEKIKF